MMSPCVVDSGGQGPGETGDPWVAFLLDACGVEPVGRRFEAVAAVVLEHPGLEAAQAGLGGVGAARDLRASEKHGSGEGLRLGGDRLCRGGRAARRVEQASGRHHQAPREHGIRVGLHLRGEPGLGRLLDVRLHAGLVRVGDIRLRGQLGPRGASPPRPWRPEP